MNFPSLRLSRAAALLAVALLAGGCATPAYYVSPPVYPAGPVPAPPPGRTMELGVVQDVRSIAFPGPDTGLGAVGGAALGGWAGSGIGSGSGNAAAIVGGVILGSLIGNAVEQQAAKRPGLELTVRLDASGRTIAVVQDDTGEPFRPGDRVRVLSDGYRTRIAH